MLLTSCSHSKLEYAQDSDSLIPPYQARFGRSEPVIAVVGVNSFTEVTDYIIPYGVLTESKIANVVALATQPGTIQMFPALKIEPHSTTSDFDLQYPEGADYVFVPAVHHSNDPTLIQWLVEQAEKGTTIIGVCDGAKVLANAGLLKGKKAVAHWYSLNDLSQEFIETRWFNDARYVADHKIITTTGVTASIPVSVALIEAIAGNEKATSVATSLGIKSWGAEHRTDKFKLSIKHIFTAASNWLSFWSKDKIGIPVTEGIDEIALALTADPFSRTYKSKAYSVSDSNEAILSKRGLKILPDLDSAKENKLDYVIELDGDMSPVDALDTALVNIQKEYGKNTAKWVSLQLEYSSE